MIRLKSKGFSLTELVIALAVLFLFLAAGYALFTRISRNTTFAAREAGAHTDATKALDRLATEIQNTIELSSARATKLGSIPPRGLTTCNSNICTDCPIWMKFTLSSGWGYIPLIPQGLVPLPGRNQSNIDQPFWEPPFEVPNFFFHFTVVYPPPSPLPDGTNVADSPSDGIRVLYLPYDSTPLSILSDVDDSASSTSSGIALSPSDIQEFKVGDFGILFDPAGRELFRVTGIEQNHLVRDPLSLWNLPFTRKFAQASSLVERVELATYAHNPDTKEVVRDNHALDDGCDTATGVCSQLSFRNRNWVTVAKNVEEFRIFYDEWDTTRPPPTNEMKILKTSRETRTPIAALPANNPMNGCENQLGFPLFRSVRIEYKLASSSTEPTSQTIAQQVLVQRAAAPTAFQTDPGGDPVQGLPEKEYGTVPTPASTVGDGIVVPNPTVTPLSTPAPTPTPVPTPIPSLNGGTGDF